MTDCSELDSLLEIHFMLAEDFYEKAIDFYLNAEGKRAAVTMIYSWAHYRHCEIIKDIAATSEFLTDGMYRIQFKGEHELKKAENFARHILFDRYLHEYKEAKENLAAYKYFSQKAVR
jgi:hypothetical protein